MFLLFFYFPPPIHYCQTPVVKIKILANASSINCATFSVHGQTEQMSDFMLEPWVCMIHVLNS